MLMTEETRGKLNDVITHSFLLNMICDNLVYEIDYACYPKTAKIVHASYAHYWPMIADEWSDLAISLNARPKRGNLIAADKDFGGDLAAIFAEMLKATDDYKKEIIDLIDTADMNDDVEVKIKGEEMLLKIMPYRKQADIWATEANRYSKTGDYKEFDEDIESFTTMIAVSD